MAPPGAMHFANLAVSFLKADISIPTNAAALSAALGMLDLSACDQAVNLSLQPCMLQVPAVVPAPLWGAQIPRNSMSPAIRENSQNRGPPQFESLVGIAANEVISDRDMPESQKSIVAFYSARNWAPCTRQTPAEECRQVLIALLSRNISNPNDDASREGRQYFNKFTGDRFFFDSWVYELNGWQKGFHTNQDAPLYDYLPLVIEYARAFLAVMPRVTDSLSDKIVEAKHAREQAEALRKQEEDYVRAQQEKTRAEAAAVEAGRSAAEAKREEVVRAWKASLPSDPFTATHWQSSVSGGTYDLEFQSGGIALLRAPGAADAVQCTYMIASADRTSAHLRCGSRQSNLVLEQSGGLELTIASGDIIKFTGK